MFPLSVVPAVGIRTVFFKYRVIDHLPHAAANQTVVRIDLLPVRLHITGSDTHSVSVLAEKIRPVAHFPN